MLDSDRLVHDLLGKNEVRAAVAASLGTEPLPAGNEGRRRIAEIVFTDDEQLDRLEAILFPKVAAEIDRWMKSDATAKAMLAVVELPMLFEAKLEPAFDKIVLVTAPQEIRQLRHEGRVGLADFERRASRQLPEDQKRTRSDFFYDNTGSPEELDEFVAATTAAIVTG